MKKIFQVLNSIVQLSDADSIKLDEILERKELDKGAFWIEEGKKNYDIAFVEDGYLRKFYLKEGVEITDFFYFEKDFSADLPSIWSNSNPQASIIAMEETTLTTFSYHEFDELCKNSLALEHLHRKIIEFSFLRFYKRSVSFILQSPKDRYYDLILSSPDIFLRAAQYHIASYLGISPQHLSRLRRQKVIS